MKKEYTHDELVEYIRQHGITKARLVSDVKRYDNLKAGTELYFGLTSHPTDGNCLLLSTMDNVTCSQNRELITNNRFFYATGEWFWVYDGMFQVINECEDKNKIPKPKYNIGDVVVYDNGGDENLYYPPCPSCSGHDCSSSCNGECRQPERTVVQMQIGDARYCFLKNTWTYSDIDNLGYSIIPESKISFKLN